MAFTRIFVGLLLVGVSLADTAADTTDHQQRSTRTLGTLFGGGTQTQQQQVDKPVPTAQYDRPLVYHVKYYDTRSQVDSKSSPIDKSEQRIRYRPEQVGSRFFFYSSPGENRGNEQQPGGVTGGVVNVNPQQQNQGYLGYYYNPVLGLGGGQQPVLGQPNNVKEQQVLVPCPVDYVYVPTSDVKKQPVVPVVEKVVQPAVVQPVVQPVVYSGSTGVNGVVQQNKQGVVVVPYAAYPYGQYQYQYVAAVQPYVSSSNSGSVGVGVGNNSPYVGYYDEQQHRYVYLPQSPYVYPANYPYVYKSGVGVSGTGVSGSSGVSPYPYNPYGYNPYGVYQLPLQVVPVKPKDGNQQHKQQVSEPKKSTGD